MSDHGPQFTSYLNALLEANRSQARLLIAQAIHQAGRVEEVYDTLLWPIIEHLDHLLRIESINRATHELAVRIHRQICDQVAAHLPMMGQHGKRVVLTCGAGEPEELAGQLVADRFEADGWEVYFLGGGVPNDEILQLIGRVRPQVMVVFASKPAELPGVRRMLDLIRGVNVCPGMNVLVGGGVFNRAEGLAEEIGADLSATTIRGVLEVAMSAEPKGEAGPARKRRRRRGSPYLQQVA
ncbi:MAG: cobalamin B12-binding domain-containing protein [Phycisphaerae bacterium]|nr:cobalamin B12-binding domain-containing protein [Phycisphaerae bacterium]